MWWRAPRNRCHVCHIVSRTHTPVIPLSYLLFWTYSVVGERGDNTKPSLRRASVRSVLYQFCLFFVFNFLLFFTTWMFSLCYTLVSYKLKFGRDDHVPCLCEIEPEYRSSRKNSNFYAYFAQTICKRKRMKNYRREKRFEAPRTMANRLLDVK